MDKARRFVCPWVALAVTALTACGPDSADPTGSGGGLDAGGSGGSDGGLSGDGPSIGDGGDAGTNSPDADATAPAFDGAVPPPPMPVCTAPSPANVSAPTAVIGNGTPASCTASAVTIAIAAGGVVTFNCGASPLTIALTQAATITHDLVLDGGDKITLSGGDQTRILSIPSSFDLTTPNVVVQNLTFTKGYTTDVPNTMEVSSGGAAILRVGGTLTVNHCTFTDNHGPVTGQDVAGGAISSQGVGETTIVGSIFSGNSCSNGGALGSLGNGLTIVNTTLSSNSATGDNGNPGHGGNGGAASIDGQGKTITICGSTFSGNHANAFGGGLFRVSYVGEPTNIDRTTFDGNTIPDAQPSMAGGLYLQGTTITLKNSTISNNAAKSAGGAYFGPASTANLTNVTIADNTALSSLGGGLAVDGSVTGTFLNCTIAGNHAPGPVAFAGGIAGGEGLQMTNTVVSGNTAGNGYNPISCTKKLTSGGGNLQFPVARAGGGSDDPGSLCADGILIADAVLGALGDHGGPTATKVPAAGSPAFGKGTGCPPTDQRGQPRAATCTSGAVE